MAKLSQDEHDRRVAEVQQMLLTVRRSTTVQRNIAERYGITTRQARTWIQRAYAKWREDEKALGTPEQVREARRDKARDTYETVIGIALNRTEVVKNEDGEVVLDEQEFLANGNRNPSYKRPLTRPRPDLVRVVTALLGIRHLDGLDQPTKLELEFTGLEERLPDLDSMSDVARAHLVAGLEAIAPGGDLRKLAGDLFNADRRALKTN